jgi:hypothetical protein
MRMDEREGRDRGDPSRRGQDTGRSGPGRGDDPRPRDGGRDGYDSREVRERGRPGGGDHTIIGELVAGLADLFSGLLQGVPLGPSKVKELTYRAAVAWFVEKQPPVLDPVRGALLRKRHGEGWLIFQTFVGDDGEPIADRRGQPWGRKFIALALDEELDSVFDGRDLVIFE